MQQNNFEIELNEYLQKHYPGVTRFDERPWGNYRIIDAGQDFQVKRIEVKPGKRLSYQTHKHRSEHWYVVSGEARVTLNDKEIILKKGEAVDIAIGAAHRVENPGQELLIFIEVQQGDYVGEDDIVRIEDDFGRDK